VQTPFGDVLSFSEVHPRPFVTCSWCGADIRAIIAVTDREMAITVEPCPLCTSPPWIVDRVVVLRGRLDPRRLVGVRAGWRYGPPPTTGEEFLADLGEHRMVLKYEDMSSLEEPGFYFASGVRGILSPDYDAIKRWRPLP